MAGFSSVSDMYTEMVTNGKSDEFWFKKTAANAGASAAGVWHEFLTATGTPGAISFSGSAGVATQLTAATTNAIPLQTVSPDLRFLSELQVLSSTATVPIAVAYLCDFLLYYPSCVVTGTQTTLDNTATLPRYTDGKGVHCIVAVQTANGATNPALTLTYNDTNNASQSATMTAVQTSSVATALYANNGSPFLPWGGTGSGIKSITSYTIASGTTGTACFILVKPLMAIPLVQVNVGNERDMLGNFISLPRIQDNACLGFIVRAGGAMAASATLTGRLRYGWG